MKDFLGIVLLALISCFLSGCGRKPDTDVTSSPEYNFSTFAGTVWKTRVKTALVSIKGPGRGAPYTDLSLVTPKHFDPAHPEYTSLHNMQIIAELPPGTRLRIKRLMQSNGNWGGVWVEAEVEGGPQSQTFDLSALLLAKNRYIWPGWSDSKEWGVDPDLLAK